MVTAPSYDFDPSWQGHDQEARLLVELLRTSRLTVLYCESGANKTAFLQSALMPLLRRRAGDRLVPASARESGVVVPFPDRRKRSAGKASKRKREFVVHFDDWTGDPLSALLSRVQDSAGIAADERAATPQRLSDALDALSGRLDAHFIILLDRFEEFLRTPTDHEGHGRFTNQWVEAIHRPDLPANFLISLDDDARPRLARLRSLIPDLDDFSLKLGRPPGVKTSLAPPDEPEAPAGIAVGAPPILTETVTPLEPAPSVAVVPRASAASTDRAVGRPKVKRPTPPRTAVKTEDVYALIEATLARTATSNTNDPFQEDDLATDAAPADAEIPPPARVVEPTPTAAATAGWCVVFKRIGQWLGLGSRP